MNGTPPRESVENADVVIHLTGEPVAHRWNAEIKRRIRDSRVAGTRHLVEALAALPRRPAALISASGVGYYGSRGDETLEESSPAGKDFLAEVCVAWEREAQAAETLGMRVAVIRIGMVLDSRGGALQRMLPAFRLGVGGRLGSGRQWVSWIHLNDLDDLFRYVVETPVQGPLNGVAPEPVRNIEFTRQLAMALKRPAIFPVPESGLRLLFGELAQVLLASQRAMPRAAEAAGF